MEKFLDIRGRKPECVIFLSGSGSNAEMLLRDWRENRSEIPYEIGALVTDRPRSSRAAGLAKEYGLPLAAVDIADFYAEHGEDGIALTTARRRELREQWTEALRRELKQYRIDFGLLAGFVPLTNITRDYPCLNVHPGDLTIEDSSGRRILAGLHYKPVETAIVKGFGILRSSVILAGPYTGSGVCEMDTGHVLGVSAPLHLQLNGIPLEKLQEIYWARKSGEKIEDALRAVAWRNVEALKRSGDHVVFPAVARDFAGGRFGFSGETLFFRTDRGTFAPVKTVEYFPDGTRKPWFLEKRTI